MEASGFLLFFWGRDIKVKEIFRERSGLKRSARIRGGVETETRRDSQRR